MIVIHPFAGQQPSDPDRGSRGTSSTDAGKRFRRRRIPTPEVLRIQSWPQPTPPIHDVSDVDDDGGDGANEYMLRRLVASFRALSSPCNISEIVHLWLVATKR
jgi:hypothetical protein